MKTVAFAIVALVLLGPVVGWAQTTTTPAPATPRSPAAPAPAPGVGTPSGAPGGTDTAAPRAQTPATPNAPGEAAGGPRIFGLHPVAAIIIGLVILGVIIALVSGRRRDRDVAVETRIEPGPDDRPLGMTESELERERRRRAS